MDHPAAPQRCRETCFIYDRYLLHHDHELADMPLIDSNILT
jgi:hypothetical protein